MTHKNIDQMTLKEFQQLENFNQSAVFTDVILVPMDDIHESGYRCMKFVLVCRGEIVGVVSGWSDVVHINGIGGYGVDFEKALSTGTVRRVGWSLDCLPNSGCIRLFSDHLCSCDKLFVGSDFCVYPDFDKTIEMAKNAQRLWGNNDD